MEKTYTEFQFKEHTSVKVNLVIGEKVIVNGFSRRMDGKEVTIEELKPAFGSSESGVLVKINGLDMFFDSGWITKIKRNEQK